jgi:hypothetical protein
MELLKKKKAFEEGLKSDTEFEKLKKIHIEIKELERQLENHSEQSANMQEPPKRVQINVYKGKE